MSHGAPWVAPVPRAPWGSKDWSTNMGRRLRQESPWALSRIVPIAVYAPSCEAHCCFVCQQMRTGDLGRRASWALSRIVPFAAHAPSCGTHSCFVCQQMRTGALGRRAPWALSRIVPFTAHAPSCGTRRRCTCCVHPALQDVIPRGAVGRDALDGMCHGTLIPSEPSGRQLDQRSSVR